MSAKRYVTGSRTSNGAATLLSATMLPVSPSFNRNTDMLLAGRDMLIDVGERESLITLARFTGSDDLQRTPAQDGSML